MNIEQKIKAAFPGLKFDHRYTGAKGDFDTWSCTIINESGGCKHVMTFPYFKGYGHKCAAPSLEEILETLVMDYEYGDFEFEEFCEHLYYDPKSASAKRTYEDLKSQRFDLQRLFDENDIEKLTRIFAEH